MIWTIDTLFGVSTESERRSTVGTCWAGRSNVSTVVSGCAVELVMTIAILGSQWKRSKEGTLSEGLRILNEDLIH